MIHEIQKTLLLVDDEAILALNEKITLENYGFEVITANNGEKAIEAVQTIPGIDLILMDIDLGHGIDGTETAKIILAKYAIPLIFLSSHTEMEMVKKTEGITSFGYIVKGSAESVLLASIKIAFRLAEAYKKTEDQKERLRVTLRSIGDAVIATDKDGTIACMNPVAERLTGWREKEARGKELADVLNIVNAVTRQNCENPIERITKNARSTGLKKNTLLISRCGRERFLSATTAPIRDVAGKVNGTVLVFRDVTKRRKAEEAIQRSGKRDKRAAHGIKAYCYSVRLDSGIPVVMNHGSGCVALTGYHESEFERDAFLWSRLIYHEDFAWVIGQINLIGSLKESKPLVHRIVRKDGQIRWVRNTIAIHRGNQGSHQTYDGFIQDITEQRLAEHNHKGHKATKGTGSNKQFRPEDKKGRIERIACENPGMPHTEAFSMPGQVAAYKTVTGTAARTEILLFQASPKVLK